MLKSLNFCLVSSLSKSLYFGEQYHFLALNAGRLNLNEFDAIQNDWGFQYECNKQQANQSKKVRINYENRIIFFCWNSYKYL